MRALGPLPENQKTGMMPAAGALGRCGQMSPGLNLVTCSETDMVDLDLLHSIRLEGIERSVRAWEKKGEMQTGS